MAFRNTKIASKIVYNNSKYLSNKAEIIVPISSNKGTEITKNEFEQERSNETTPFRYIMSNTKKPRVLPKIEFPKEPEELIPPEMQYLQPSMLPKFMELREIKNKVEWEPTATDKKELECPFPEPIRELRTKTLTVSDMKKAELKSPSINVNFKNNNFSIITRRYSTSPYFTLSRTFAKSSKKPIDDKCDDPPKKKCVKQTGCPSFIMRDCPEGKPKSDCLRHYTSQKCSKKLAPYPSYSESCAERLADDPSECMQCPWQKCGGVESIKPPKRNYHTSIINHRNLQLIPGNITNDVNFMPFKQCDAKKEPCKRPPGKCNKKEEKKKEKCPPSAVPKKKKCTNWSSAYGFWNAKENILPTDTWQDIAPDPIENFLKCEQCTKLPFDKNQADYDKVSKRKCQFKKNPKCKRKKRKTVPDSCTSDDCKKQCMCHNSHLIVLELGKCGNKSNKEKGPSSKKKCPVVDRTIDESMKPKNPCCIEEKKDTHKKPKIKPKVYVPDARDY